MYCIVPALIDRRIGVRPRNVQGLHYRRIGLVRWRPAALAHVHDVRARIVHDVHVIHNCTMLSGTRRRLLRSPGSFPPSTTTTVPAGVILGQLSLQPELGEELNFEKYLFKYLIISRHHDNCPAGVILGLLS